MTTTIKRFSKMLFAFVLCAGLAATSCETADPVDNDKDPENSENTGDTGNTGDNNSSSDIIVFADDIVKKSCVDVFDIDGDGEISYDEAAEVKDLSGVTLRFIEDFLTFDEFQYFVNVESIPDNFFSKSKYLKSIILPESVETIGKNVFYGCKSLTKIEFPQGLETIGDYAFRRCTGLTKIEFPQGLKTIGESAFDECTGLTEIEFQQGLKTIGDHAFSSCSGLTEVFCRPVVPPTLENSVFPTNLELRIYIPKDSVEHYMRDYNWNIYSSNIVGYDF